MPKANVPVFKSRLGYVEAAVWQGEGGFYNVTVNRSYKDGDEWKNTDSFGHGDLQNAREVLQHACDWISSQ